MSSPDLERRKLALIAEIHEAFRGVSREGGISWSQTMLHDHGVRPYTPREYREAGEKDREKSWEVLVDPDKWKPHPSWGGFCFIDAIGFRYYVAPAMIRMLTFEREEVLRPRLLEDDRLGLFSALNNQQSRCIVGYLEWMRDSILESGGVSDVTPYETALAYWRLRLMPAANSDGDGCTESE